MTKEEFRGLRLRLGRDQAEMGELMGVTGHTVYRYEAGLRSVPVKKVQALLARLSPAPKPRDVYARRRQEAHDRIDKLYAELMRPGRLDPGTFESVRALHRAWEELLRLHDGPPRYPHRALP